MFSNKTNVNILTALLVKHGITHAVVCPGSRNAPIVHNLHECPDIQCYPVTDERSAGFYALGMAQALRQPVAVCVTSGSALLNLAPAVAEASYQHVPLVVISADRPQQWIDQLDGQTLPQPDALGRFVAKAVNLPEIPSMQEDIAGEQSRHNEQHWYCNRLVNEALMAVSGRVQRPVHINVPLSEPLFCFDVPELPAERVVTTIVGKLHPLQLTATDGLLAAFRHSCRPMIVVGQDCRFAISDDWPLRRHAVILHESLSGDSGAVLFDEVLAEWGDTPSLAPDFVIYGGGTLVSKRLKKFLRNVRGGTFWEVSADGALHDTFMHANGVIEGNIMEVLQIINDSMADTGAPGQLADTSEFVGRWQQALEEAERRVTTSVPEDSLQAAVQCFERQLADLAVPHAVHYGNSTAIRLANLYSRGFVYCNRGVNGIEGSLSTAAGFSVVTGKRVFCVLGDLSFFYDQNALWNRNLRGNLRVLLLNNGCGGIFHRLPGLEESPARDELVAACHQTTAEGICQQHDVYYHHASNLQELAEGMALLLTADLSRPMVLEVFGE